MKTIDIKDIVKGEEVQIWNNNAEKYLDVTVVRKGYKKALGHYFVYEDDYSWVRAAYTEQEAKRHPVQSR